MDRLELMQQFVHVAEAKSLSGAAKRIGCTEPTLSKRLSYLEESLGAKLLLRSPRGVRLTEGGERYVEACRRLLADLREVEAGVSQIRGGLQGLLRVYLPLTLGEGPLTRIALEFQRHHPELRLDLAVQDGWVDLATTGVDLAIRVGAVLDPSVAARNLGGMGFVLVASPGYLARAGVPETIEALSRHAYLRLGGDSDEPLATPDGPAVLRVTCGVTFNNPRAVKTAALADAGIARLARWLVQPELQDGRLVEILPGIAPEPIPVCALHVPSRYPMEKVRSFIRFTAERLLTLPGWIPPAAFAPPLGAPASELELAESTVRQWLAPGDQRVGGPRVVW